MDKAFEEKEEKLGELKKRMTMDEYLKVWSQTVENAMLQHLEVTEEMAKKARGRGQVGLKETIPQAPNETRKLRNPLMQKANQYLIQARRCDQIEHRIAKGKEEKEERREKYRTLNEEAIEAIEKSLEKGQQGR